jgi:hypothetical protein
VLLVVERLDGDRVRPGAPRPGARVPATRDGARTFANDPLAVDVHLDVLHDAVVGRVGVDLDRPAHVCARGRRIDRHHRTRPGRGRLVRRRRRPTVGRPDVASVGESEADVVGRGIAERLAVAAGYLEVDALAVRVGQPERILSVARPRRVPAPGAVGVRPGDARQRLRNAVDVSVDVDRSAAVVVEGVDQQLVVPDRTVLGALPEGGGTSTVPAGIGGICTSPRAPKSSVASSNVDTGSTSEPAPNSWWLLERMLAR